MAARVPQTPVRVNVYDLTDANAYTSVIGIGFYHSGVEIGGDEYSFASGGGVFASTPKQASGATFRETIEMGMFIGTASEARRLAMSLSSEFDGNSYNLFTKNCNTYSNALCELLLNKSIPAFINRAAYLGSFVSCLMPAEATGQAPVGGTNAPRLTSRSDVLYTAFAGDNVRGLSIGAGQAVGGTAAARAPTEDPGSVRERVRQAALRRQTQHD